MKRIIVPMMTLLGLVLLMSAQCASNVNIDGTYEAVKDPATVQLVLKRDSGNKVSGTLKLKVAALKIPKLVTLADVKGELKDEGGKIIFAPSLTRLKIDDVYKEIGGALTAADKLKVDTMTKTQILFIKALKFEVLNNGAELEGKGTVSGAEVTMKFKKK